MVKCTERRVITHHGQAVGRRKAAFQPIFLKQTFVLGLNRRNSCGKGERYA
jgi:hypothetical protein